MKSWTDWKDLTSENIRTVRKGTIGVYVIRKKGSVGNNESDIIWIGQAGGGRQGIDQRLRYLLNGLKSSRPKSKNHSAVHEMKKHLKAGLQFSWLECCQAPDGVEKALLLAFWVSTGKLPDCNKKF